MKETLVPQRESSKQYLRGKLVGPFQRINKVCICPSVIDEHMYHSGATPTESFLDQIRRGPYSYAMFISCIAFSLPGFIHFYMHEHWADWYAGIAFFMVAISSPLCDAFCVYSARFDNGNDSDPYAKAAEAVGMNADELRKHVGDSRAEIHIHAPDRWNNLTRLIDRSVCVLVVLPAVLSYTIKQRPPFKFQGDFAMVLIIFAAAWTSCALGQRYRMANPCGIMLTDTKEIVLEQGYEIYMVCHEMWHFLLVLGFTLNALYRPDHDILEDHSPFYVGIISGVLIGISVGVVLTIVFFRIAAIFNKHVLLLEHNPKQRPEQRPETPVARPGGVTRTMTPVAQSVKNHGI